MKKVYIVALSLLLPCAVMAMNKKYKKNLSVFIQHREDVPPFPLLIETVRKPDSKEIIRYLFGKFSGGELAFETLLLPDDPTDPESFSRVLKEVRLPESLSRVLKEVRLNGHKKRELKNLLKYNEDVHEALRQARLSEKEVTVKGGMAKDRVQLKLGEALQKASHYENILIITQKYQS